MLRCEIRTARTTDFPAVVRVLNAHESEPLAPGAFTQWEQRRSADAGYQRLVAAGANGEIYGTGTVRVGVGFESGNALIQVFVAPAAAHKGIGQLLHAVLEHWAMEQGATHLVAVVRDDGTVQKLKRRWNGGLPAGSGMGGAEYPRLVQKQTGEAAQVGVFAGGL